MSVLGGMQDVALESSQVEPRMFYTQNESTSRCLSTGLPGKRSRPQDTVSGNAAIPHPYAPSHSVEKARLSRLVFVLPLVALLVQEHLECQRLPCFFSRPHLTMELAIWTLALCIECSLSRSHALGQLRIEECIIA